MDKTAHITPTPVQIEHQIPHSLARPMIGVTPTATGRDHFKAGIDKFGRVGAGACGIDRRMFEQPDQFCGIASGNGLIARLHFSKRRAIGNRR